MQPFSLDKNLIIEKQCSTTLSILAIQLTHFFLKTNTEEAGKKTYIGGADTEDKL